MAAAEWSTVNRLIDTYMGFGFALVKPPLMEFEAGLMSGPGVALAPQTFRLMDPVSSKMLGLRADITAQIARIAGSRLQAHARPLRLAYAGEVVRVNGTDLRPERQFCQVGAELIGAIEASADAEIITMAVAALRQLDIEGLSIDLCLPTLQPHFLRGSGLTGDDLADLAEAVRRRDREAVLTVESPVSRVLADLLNASGPVSTALPALQAVEMPSGLKGDVQRLISVVELVQRDLPDLTITVDPLERRGFEYQTGLSFTLFARDVRGELGRGGRYRSAGVMGAEPVKRVEGEAANRLATLGEPAVGFTLFMDSIMRALPAADQEKRLAVPASLTLAERQKLSAEGWVVIRDLGDQPDELAAFAVAQRCTHFWQGNEAKPVTKTD
ncbi:MAG: ATP phosphoribosyltransferase regulatory subunit [Alphaproteobacteria bacterium]|nr:ATP phosphoribosyltransferase regulatory subunit [Alphaproteobacteria bacterium SS10]